MRAGSAPARSRSVTGPAIPRVRSCPAPRPAGPGASPGQRRAPCTPAGSEAPRPPHARRGCRRSAATGTSRWRCRAPGPPGRPVRSPAPGPACPRPPRGAPRCPGSERRATLAPSGRSRTDAGPGEPGLDPGSLGEQERVSRCGAGVSLRQGGTRGLGNLVVQAAQRDSRPDRLGDRPGAGEGQQTVPAPHRPQRIPQPGALGAEREKLSG